MRNTAHVAIILFLRFRHFVEIQEPIFFFNKSPFNKMFIYLLFIKKNKGLKTTFYSVRPFLHNGAYIPLLPY